MNRLVLALAALCTTLIAAPASAQQVNLGYTGTITTSAGDSTLDLTGDASLADILNGTPVTVNDATANVAGYGTIGLGTLTAVLTSPSTFSLFLGNATSGTALLTFGDVNFNSLASTGSTGAAITGGSYSGISITGGVGTITAAVPEPATWAMMLVGFGAIGFQMRRKRPALIPQLA